MREILFRGKRKDNGEWVEGSLVELDCHNSEDYIESTQIVLRNGHSYTVHPETVGQFTEFRDKHSTMIFDKDKIRARIFKTELFETFTVSWNLYSWVVATDTSDFFDFGELDWTDIEVIGNIHDKAGGRMKTIVVDIDGTIAKVPEERLAILRRKPVDYDALYCCDFSKDEPIEDIINTVKALCDSHKYDIVFCTGRREQSRSETLKFLFKNGLNCFDGLLMRADGDERSDTVTKPELLKNAGYTPDKVAFILEDRSRMCKKWRELGYTCLQVADGDY